MGGGGFGQGVALEGRAEAAGGGFGEGAGFEEAQGVVAAGALEHDRAEDALGGDAAGGEVGAFGVGEGERAVGPAEDEVAGAGGEEAEGGAGGGAADGVEEDGGAVGVVGADGVGPAGLGVVDGEVGAARGGAGGLSGPPARAMTVAPAFLAYWTSRVPMPPAAAGTRAVEAGPRSANWRIPRAVRPVPIMATARAGSRPGGMGWRRWASATAYSA